MNRETVPYWLRGQRARPGRPLERDVIADVCVVGAGFAGLTTAYRLARAGKKVVVLELSDVPGHESGRSTAHLCSYVDDGFASLAAMHGTEGARLVVDSHSAAVDLIESLVAEEKLDCGFSRLNGYLFGPAADLRREEAASRRAGLEPELLQQGPLQDWNWGPCLKFPRQAQVDPARYLLGLAEACRRLGVAIHTRTRVVELEGGLPGFVMTEAGPAVRCQAIVLATNAPINDRVALSGRQGAYRTYVIAGKVRRGSVPKGLYWDMDEPYHYVRLDGDRLLVGGEDHRTGHADDGCERWARLEAWAQARFPSLEAVTDRWSGQVLEPVDSVAYIGRHPTEPANVYVATGDSGNGTTHGTVAGMLLCDLITGRANAWEPLYSPSRVTVGSAPSLAYETAREAAGYIRHLTAGDVASADDVPPGKGAVAGRAAVYRRPDGTLVRRSAVCPHLGGMVCWNSVEGTWDCPVHGSRYQPDGSAVCGPTRRPLAAAAIEEKPPSRRRSRRRSRSRRRGVTRSS